MMALGETSYKFTTVTCILVAALIHMVHTQTFPAWSFDAFDLFDIKVYIPVLDFSRFDPWFYVDILTYTTVGIACVNLSLIERVNLFYIITFYVLKYFIVPVPWTIGHVQCFKRASKLLK